MPLRVDLQQVDMTDILFRAKMVDGCHRDNRQTLITLIVGDGANFRVGRSVVEAQLSWGAAKRKVISSVVNSLQDCERILIGLERQDRCQWKIALKLDNRLPDICADIEYQSDWLSRELAPIIGGKTNAVRQPIKTAGSRYCKLLKRHGNSPPSCHSPIAFWKIAGEVVNSAGPWPNQGTLHHLLFRPLWVRSGHPF